MAAPTGAAKTAIVSIVCGVAAGAIARDIVGATAVMATAAAQASVGGMSELDDAALLQWLSRDAPPG